MSYREIIKPELLDKIFAHTSNNKSPEKLIEHSEKTLEYYQELKRKLGLSDIIDNIVIHFLPRKYLSLIHEMIECIIYCHDFGKINPRFQKEKMNNFFKFDMSNGILTSNHSFYGKILFDVTFSQYFSEKLSKMESDNKYNDRAIYLLCLLSLSIDRHHSPLNDIDEIANKIKADQEKQNKEGINEIESLNHLGDKLLQKWRNISHEDLYSCYTFKSVKKSKNRLLTILTDNNEEQKEALFYLFKLVYSLLITSDYYATMEYMQGIRYFNHIKYINLDIKKKAIEEFYKEKTINNKHYRFNAKLLDKKFCEHLLNKKIEDIEELNDLRTRILLEADETLKKTIENNPDKKVFYLKVPTGGGKTNISLKLILTLLDKKENIKKVFYVFPFINIIEQNYDVIKDTLDLNNEISPIYSTSSWNSDSECKEEQLRYALDIDFLNFPFVVMSNVNFFNTFIKAGKASNYRLLNLANSIVVLDEIQSLKDNDWTVFQDFITFASEYLNIHFIIMSATLPSLDKISLKLSEDQKGDFGKTTSLIENPDNYFRHQKFNGRVRFEYKEDIKSLNQVFSLLKKEIEENNPRKILVVLNTIQDCRDLYNKVDSEYFTDRGYFVCLLNSTILPHRRREIISETNKEKSKVLIISTQSIEAGVDIDCDFGIRDFAVYDSIEQIAGRINRNFTKEKDSARLFVVNLVDEEQNNTRKAQYVYNGTYRWNAVKDASSIDIKNFLENRDFESFYLKVIEFIKLRNNDKFREASLDKITKGIRVLDFPELNRMNIIDQHSISFFTNVKILLVGSKEDKIFTEAERNFLNELGVRVTDEISGQEIWEAYKNFDRKFTKGIIESKINTKLWSGILSKFCFSVQDYGNKLRNRLNQTKTESIFFLKKSYSIKEGINPNEIHPEDLERTDDFESHFL